MNFFKRLHEQNQFESINQKDHRFNDSHSGICIVNDEDYLEIVYYTPSINKRSKASITNLIKYSCSLAGSINRFDHYGDYTFYNDYED
jgi:hypothetical protein